MSEAYRIGLWKVYGPDLNGRFGGLQGTGGLEAVILDATGTTTGVINDQFGNGVATVSGGTVTWNSTRVGAYGPLPGIQAQTLTDVSQLTAATAWRSRRIDPPGFYWLGARYYEPTSGRFLSADPMGHGISPSLYDYAAGDPINGMDPDGRCAGKSGLDVKDLASNTAPLVPTREPTLFDPTGLSSPNDWTYEMGAQTELAWRTTLDVEKQILKEGAVNVVLLATGEVAVYYVVRGVRYVVIARNAAQAERLIAAAENTGQTFEGLLDARNAALNALNAAERTASAQAAALSRAEEALRRAGSIYGEGSAQVEMAAQNYEAALEASEAAEGAEALARFNWEEAHQAVLDFHN